MLGEHIDLSRGKLARGHLLLKQQVELGEGAARGLGDAEVCVDEAEEARAGLSMASKTSAGGSTQAMGSVERN